MRLCGNLFCPTKRVRATVLQSKLRVRQVERVEWVLAHDSEARAIAERAREWVSQRLTVGRVYCYWATLLTRYSRLLAFQPRPAANATRVLNVGLWNLD